MIKEEIKEKKKNGLSYGCYRVVRWLVWLFYPKIKVEGQENLPREACIAVGNHTQMNGPICAELYYPGKRRIWCAGEMMCLKEVPAYAFQDFWSKKPKAVRWFYKLLSYLIAPLSACVFNNAYTIGVYHDNRLLKTLKETVAALQDDTSVIIFPENGEKYNSIICQFHDRFIDVAKLYYKRTGRAVPFVPMYMAPALKKIIIGKPIWFDPNAPLEQERERIRQYLMEQITELAIKQPRHRVVPFTNIPKKEYPWNQQ